MSTVRTPTFRKTTSGTQKVARGKYYLTFPSYLAAETVICDMYDRVGVRFSIRQAHVSDDVAILGVELTGAEKRVRRAEDYLRSRGVRVDRVGLAPT